MTEHQALRLLKFQGQAKHSFERVYCISYCAPASGKPMMQRTAQDYRESRGWWDQQTLAHTFSKSHLVTAPPQPTFDIL